MCFVIYSVFRVFINLVVSNMSCEDLKFLASEIAHLATKLCPSFISPSEFLNDYTFKKKKKVILKQSSLNLPRRPILRLFTSSRVSIGCI